MGESLLERRVRRFRHGAYLGTAIITAALAARDASLPLAAGAALFLLSPHLLAWLQREQPYGLGSTRLQAAENVVTAAVVLVLALPLVPTTAVLGALLCGTVAQQGFRGLAMACATLCAGTTLGFVLRFTAPVAGSPWFDAMGLLLIVAYTTPLSALGYEETMKIHRARTDLRAKTRELERLCERLSKYLAPSVYQRIVDDNSPIARLRRVHVTVCFVDLADFTGLTERLAPEELALLLNDFLFEVAALAANAGGTVDKFLGDGVLVYFGDPASRGPKADALDCVEMTRKLPDLLATLSHRWLSHGIAVSAAARVGVANGFCTVGDFGGGARLDHTIVGKPVNLASRLKDEARLGEVLVSETVRLLLGDSLTGATATRNVSLKGMPGTLAVVSVVPASVVPTSVVSTSVVPTSVGPRIDGAGAGP